MVKKRVFSRAEPPLKWSFKGWAQAGGSGAAGPRDFLKPHSFFGPEWPRILPFYLKKHMFLYLGI